MKDIKFISSVEKIKVIKYEKTHFKLSFSIILLLIQGCATNDSNSRLVRFWNDGFIYNEKKMDDGQKCSGDANGKYPNLKPVDAMWLQYYENCMKKRGY